MKNRTKNEILKIWQKNIYNKELSQSQLNNNFSGKSGNLLEIAFGLKVNNENKSDFIDFELKLYSSIITFGDWKGIYLWEINQNISRNDFLRFFGHYNKIKKNYYFTGPLYFGEISKRGFYWELKRNRLNLCYNSLEDSKQYLVPKKFQTILILVTWNIKDLKTKYLNKFSGNIILAKKIKGIHKKLLIINNISWNNFLFKFKNNIIKFDPCVSTKCFRNRSLFRIPTNFLLSLGYKEYSIVNNKLLKKTFNCSEKELLDA